MASNPHAHKDLLEMTQVELGDIPGVSTSLGEITIDQRGRFTKFFERESYLNRGFDPNFNSLSIASNIETGTIRGLHFQTSPYEEEKLISCIKGSIFDVIVDLRKNSPTFRKWAAIELSDTSSFFLSLPRGVAHGYQTLSPDSKVFYGITSEFHRSNAFSLSYLDPVLSINWPMPITQISNKDAHGLSLQEAVDLVAG